MRLLRLQLNCHVNWKPVVKDVQRLPKLVESNSEKARHLTVGHEIKERVHDRFKESVVWLRWPIKLDKHGLQVHWGLAKVLGSSVKLRLAFVSSDRKDPKGPPWSMLANKFDEVFQSSSTGLSFMLWLRLWSGRTNRQLGTDEPVEFEN